MGIRKVIKKKLTPKSRRIAAATSRLWKTTMDASNKARSQAYEAQADLDARSAEYKRRVDEARRKLGYAPGEPVERSVSGTDRYSGSSYRIGRGIPTIAEGSSKLLPTSSEEYNISQLRRRARNLPNHAEVENKIKTRMGREAVSKFRKTRTRSKTEKALRIGGRVIKGGTMAALAAAVLAEINKKKD